MYMQFPHIDRDAVTPPGVTLFFLFQVKELKV